MHPDLRITLLSSPPRRRRCGRMVPRASRMLLALLATSSLLAAVGASQTPRQREIVAAIRTRAVAASVAASEALIVELEQPEFRSALAQRGLPELSRQSGRALLERLRAEAASAEIVHNLAIWANETSDAACNAVANPGGATCPSCLGWSVGNAQDMPRTPIFQRPQLDNLWELGAHGFVQPHHVVDWMSGPDTFEVGALGCDPFSGTLPNPSPWFKDGAVDFPRNISEANERPIYAVLDLKKIDVGVPDFGPVGIVFNRSKLAQDITFMPADTGQWSYSCNLTNQGRKCQAHNDSRSCTSSSWSCRWRNGVCVSASNNCCVTSGGATGCQTCTDTSACCTSDPSYNCSAWDVTPGVTGHLDHILLAAVRMWNDTTHSHTYTPAGNLADLLGRSAAKDYFSEKLPRLLPHNNYYVETNLLATPEFSSGAGDVLFTIGTFPWLFGHRRGRQLRQWASGLGFVLVGPSFLHLQITYACSIMNGTFDARGRSGHLDLNNATSESIKRVGVVTLVSGHRIWVVASQLTSRTVACLTPRSVQGARTLAPISMQLACQCLRRLGQMPWHNVHVAAGTLALRGQR